MEIIDYVGVWDSETRQTKFLVEISDVHWWTAAWYSFWERLDPCCRKPWWVWYPLVKIEYAASRHREIKPKTVIEVDKEWAQTHFPWDVSVFLDEERNND